VSVATISRYLTRAGLVTPQPMKRLWSSYIRFQPPFLTASLSTGL
jgi:hypothetical protein